MRLRDVPIMLFGIAIGIAAGLHFTAGLLALIGLWPQGKPFAIGLGVLSGLAVMWLVGKGVKAGRLNFDVKPDTALWSVFNLRQWCITGLWFIPFGAVALYGGDVVWKVPAKRDSIGESLASSVVTWLVVSGWLMFRKYRATQHP